MLQSATDPKHAAGRLQAGGLFIRGILVIAFSASVASCGDRTGERSQVDGQERTALIPQSAVTSEPSTPPVARPESASAPNEDQTMLMALEQRYFRECVGDHWFDLTPRYANYMWEVRGLTLSRSTMPLSEVDRLNGIEWQGQVSYSYPYRKRVNLYTSKYENNAPAEWQPATDPRLPDGADQGSGTLLLRRRQGGYEAKVNSWSWERFPDETTEEVLKFNCGSS